MSKSRMGLAVVGAAVMFAALSPGAAQAGFRLGLNPLGIARFAVGRVMSLTHLRHAHMAERGGRIRTAGLTPPDLRGTIESAHALSNPAARVRLTTVAALAGWHGGRDGSGWWRHGDGGYGWVGPLFWPFAYDDLSDYVVLGDGTAFWAYGYGDIYAAIFTPYASADLAAYVEPGRRHRRVPSVQQLCGDGRSLADGKSPADGRSLADLPVERIAQAVEPNEAQRAALDELAAVWHSAAEIIHTSCPSEAPMTGLDRLALIQNRLATMISAVASVQPQLSNFFALLNNDQKARLDALANNRRKPSVAQEAPPAQASAANAREAALAQLLQGPGGCERPPPPAMQWRTDEITASLHLNDVQSAALEVVQDTTLRTLYALNTACEPQGATTMPARLAAAKARLEAMLQVTGEVRDALDDFYFNLSDEQKTQFEAIGPGKAT